MGENCQILTILPTEILHKIFKLSKNKLHIRLVNTICKGIIDSIIFLFPSFHKPVQMKSILHFPVKAIRSSHIRGQIHTFPKTLQTFIINVNEPALNPIFIRKNKDIEFLISINHLSLNEFHISNFIEDNVKLFTTENCPINVSTLHKFNKFVFKTLTISHIEQFPNSKEDILENLTSLNIERLVLDYVQEKLDTRRLENLQNVTYLSSGVFERFTEFPLYLCEKLKTLESVNFRSQTYLNFEGFKKIKKSHVGQTSLTFDKNKVDYSYFKIFHYPRSGIVRTRSNVTIHLQTLPPPWILSLQENIFVDKWRLGSWKTWKPI